MSTTTLQELADLSESANSTLDTTISVGVDCSTGDAPIGSITYTDSSGDMKVSPYSTITTTNSSGWSLAPNTELDEHMTVSIGDKRFNVKKILELLMEAYLPIRKEGDKVSFVKIVEVLEEE